MGRDTFHYTRSFKTPSNLVLNTSKEGAFTTSLGNLLMCLTILIVKHLFLISNLNLPSFSLKLLSFVLSLHALVESPSLKLSCRPPSGTGRPQCRPVQDLALDLVEPHKVRMGPPIKPVKVPLDVIRSLQHVDCTTQLGGVGELAEDTFNPTVHVASKDVKQCCSHYWSLRNTACHWSPAEH